MNQSQLQPVVFGGLFIGVLSALPVVELGNCACCLWVVGGGMLTAYLLQRDRAEPLALGEGAVGGLMAGLVGAVVFLMVSIPIGIVTAPFERRMMEFILNSQSDMPPEVREMLESFGTESMGVAAIAIEFVTMVIAGVIFATLGGMFGVLLFRPSSPAPPYPPVPPSSVPPVPPVPQA